MVPIANRLRQLCLVRWQRWLAACRCATRQKNHPTRWQRTNLPRSNFDERVERAGWVQRLFL